MGRHKKNVEEKENTLHEEEVAEEEVVEEETSSKKKDDLNLSVGNPEDFRPKKLPLLIKGNWKNDTQAEYAKVLNGYIYKNPKKFKEKEAELIANLKLLGEHPEEIMKFQGVKDEHLTLKNQLMQE